MTGTILILLFLFQVKHFLADYPLQNKFMLGKFKENDWTLPLSSHCLVHSAFTFFICLFFAEFEIALSLAFFDFVIHFIMDRIKASPKMLGRFESISKGEFKGLTESYAMVNSDKVNKLPIGAARQAQLEKNRIEKRFKSNTYFWWSLGLDQAVHHFTHYLIIYLLL